MDLYTVKHIVENSDIVSAALFSMTCKEFYTMYMQKYCEKLTVFDQEYIDHMESKYTRELPLKHSGTIDFYKVNYDKIPYTPFLYIFMAMFNSDFVKKRMMIELEGEPVYIKNHSDIVRNFKIEYKDDTKDPECTISVGSREIYKGRDVIKNIFTPFFPPNYNNIEIKANCRARFYYDIIITRNEYLRRIHQMPIFHYYYSGDVAKGLSYSVGGEQHLVEYTDKKKKTLDMLGIEYQIQQVPRVIKYVGGNVGF